MTAYIESTGSIQPTESIQLSGAREHNLRDLTLAIPKNRITVFTGVSGSGKSSLVFDTIAAESQRQLDETYTTFVRNRMPRYGRPDVDAIENLSPAIMVDQKRLGGNTRSTVGTITDINALMRMVWSRAGTPYVGSSNLFSFNDPGGMCPTCKGLGTARSVDLDELLDRDLALSQGAIRFPTFQVGGWMYNNYVDTGLFDMDKPLREFSTEEWNAFVHGVDESGRRGRDGGQAWSVYEGLLSRFERIWLPKDPESLTGRMREAFDRVVRLGTCTDCGGSRLAPAPRSSRVHGRTIVECSAEQVDELVEFFRGVEAPGAEPVVAALRAQLERLVAIGLGYLTLDRPTTTLSGGESQRVKMVRHLGSSLTGMCYVFDEPSIGLHPHDVGQLTTLLRGLRDKGNTVLVVEHDPDVIAVADHVVDIGPGAGADGGEVTYAGDLAGLLVSDTPTGRQLGRRGTVPPRAVRRPRGHARIDDASEHNLRDVTVDVPLGVLTAVTGVAGSGKSTLVHGYLPRVCRDTVLVDQSAVHVSRRSSPATYTGILDPIRELFARANGVRPALFSPNSEGGCPTCGGLGLIYTDLAFMDPMISTCEDCGGRRFTEEVLAHTYAGHDIGQVLDLAARDALDVFDQPRIAGVLRRLVDVGLGYVSLGQPLTTLSGGELQRLKLADELRRPGGVYVFDEPTTGLHLSDVEGLIGLLDRLVDEGATVVVIEHALDVIARADWVIDLGPGAGRHGGRIVAEGTPSEVARIEASRTGQHLRKLLGAAD